MTRFLIAVAAVTIIAGTGITMAEADDAGPLYVGAGVRYWVSLEDVELDRFEDSGVSWLATVQIAPSSLLRFEVDVELFDEGFYGSTEAVWAPQGYLILGSTIYAGAGAGVFYFDGEFADDPFYALKAGLNVEILPSVYLDINGNYLFTELEDLEDEATGIDTDTVFLGAAARINF